MQLPQVLSKGGIKYVVFARPGAGESSNLDFEHSEFNWISPDGSVIFTHAMPSYFCVGDKIGRQDQDNDEAIQEVWDKLKPHSITIANRALRITFDSHGNIISLIGKDNEEREIIEACRYGNQLICQEDIGDEYEYCLGRVLGTTEDYPCTIKMYKGPVMTRLIAESKFTETNSISREVKLYEDLDRIDFRTELDWYGENKAVFVLFPLNFRGEITEEVPYGAIVRPEGRYPVVNWVDYGDKQYGVSLLNRGLPDNCIRNGKIYVTLLRSIKNVGVYSKAGPDIECPDACEKGNHTFEYSLYPHSGSWRKAFTYRRGWELNNPLI